MRAPISPAGLKRAEAFPVLSCVFQSTKARLHSWTEGEAHNLTHDDGVWELVKAADRAVLATATPLKRVAELRGVAKTAA